MLVLSRKVGERIMVGKDIELVVVEIRGGRVKLGVEAPRAVPVVRSEIAGDHGPEPKVSPVAVPPV